MAHQYMHKIFHDPHKYPPSPLPLTYLIYGPYHEIFFSKDTQGHKVSLTLENLQEIFTSLLYGLYSNTEF